MNTDKIQLPSLEYFSFGNGYTGSAGEFNYRIVSAQDQLKTAVWHSRLCFEKCNIIDTAEFPITKEGIQQLAEWLEQQYATFLSLNH